VYGDRGTEQDRAPGSIFFFFKLHLLLSPNFSCLLIYAEAHFEHYWSPVSDMWPIGIILYECIMQVRGTAQIKQVNLLADIDKITEDRIRHADLWRKLIRAMLLDEPRRLSPSQIMEKVRWNFFRKKKTQKNKNKKKDVFKSCYADHIWHFSYLPT
jgi:hypothetical protein